MTTQLPFATDYHAPVLVREWDGEVLEALADLLLLGLDGGVRSLIFKLTSLEDGVDHGRGHVSISLGKCSTVSCVAYTS